MTNPFASEENDAAAAPDADGYDDAVKELESILENLEKDEVDVDDLTRKVKRAEELLKFCQDRLHQTEVQVSQIVSNLESDLTAAAERAEGEDSENHGQETPPEGENG